MASTNTVQITYDKPTYALGERITMTLTGAVTTTSDVNVTGITTSLLLADGSVVAFSAPPFIVKDGQTNTQVPKISKVTDPSGRVWTVAADGKTATATA